MDNLFRFYAWPFLLLLLLMPVLVWWYRTRGAKSVASFAYSDIEPFRSYRKSLKVILRGIMPYLNLFILALVIIALARPQFGTREREIITHGVDITMAVDVSGSMAAEDFKPKNRLEASKEVFKEFIRGRKNDRIGLIIFAGRAYTQVPLTLDYSILESFIEKLRLGMMEDGTAIGLAIASGVNRLRKSNAKSKVLILLTDGENNAGDIDPITAAKLAKSLGIKIYTIGMGKKGGAPIPYNHPVYGKVYSKVLTKLDEESLMEIASITDGRYFRAENMAKLKQVYKKIDSLEKTEMKSKEFDNYREMANYIMVPVFILLLVELLLSVTWLRKIP